MIKEEDDLHMKMQIIFLFSWDTGKSDVLFLFHRAADFLFEFRSIIMPATV